MKTPSFEKLAEEYEAAMKPIREELVAADAMLEAEYKAKRRAVRVEIALKREPIAAKYDAAIEALRQRKSKESA